MKASAFFVMLLLPFVFAFPHEKDIYSKNIPPTIFFNTCDPPSNLTLTGQAPGTVSLSWSGCGGCFVSGYQLYYYRTEDNFTSIPVSTANTSFTFENLPSGHYRFYVAAECSGGETSTSIWYDVEQN